MKKLLYSSIAILVISMSQASYEIKLKLNEGESILFKNKSTQEEVPTVPTGDGWVSYGMSIISTNNVGSLYDCTNWLPLTDDTPSVFTITQTRTCKQDKEGYRQEYYYNENTGDEKFVGVKTPYTRTDNLSLSQSVQGTGPACLVNNKYQWVDIYDHPTSQNIEFLRREILRNGYAMLAYNNDMVNENTTSYVLSGGGGDYRYTKSTLSSQTQYSDSYWINQGKLNVYKHIYSICIEQI